METLWFIPWKRIHEKKKGRKFSYGKNEITKGVRKELNEDKKTVK